MKSKRTFKEQVERRRKKAADRDDRWRQEETLDEVVAEVSRLRDELSASRDEAAKLRDTVATLKTFVGGVPVDSDGKPLVTVRERLEQYEEQYRSLLDQARDQNAKVIAAEGMSGMFLDLRKQVESLKKDLQSPPTDGDLFATASEVASLRERMGNVAKFVGYRADPLIKDRGKTLYERVGDIEADVRARPVTNEDMGYEPEWAANLKRKVALHGRDIHGLTKRVGDLGKGIEPLFDHNGQRTPAGRVKAIEREVDRLSALLPKPKQDGTVKASPVVFETLDNPPSQRYVQVDYNTYHALVEGQPKSDGALQKLRAEHEALKVQLAQTQAQLTAMHQIIAERKKEEKDA